MAKNKPSRNKAATKRPTTTKKQAPQQSASLEQRPKAVTAKRNVLGRGLSALLSDSESTSRTSQPTYKSIEEVPVADIVANPYQPRAKFDKQALEELAQSIRVHGIVQPVTVRAVEADKYQLISGERRLQACKIVGLQRVPAFVRKAEDAQMLEMALIENIQREALNAIEIALSYQRLLSECKLKQEDLARRVGKERSTVTNYLRLLRLPPAVQAALRDKHISMGHARSLLSVEDADVQLLLLQKIQKEGLSVRQTEAATRKPSQVATPSPQPSSKRQSSEAYRVLQQELASALGTRVQLRQTKGEQGEIRITYFSEDDLTRILDLIRS